MSPSSDSASNYSPNPANSPHFQSAQLRQSPPRRTRSATASSPIPPSDISPNELSSPVRKQPAKQTPKRQRTSKHDPKFTPASSSGTSDIETDDTEPTANTAQPRPRNTASTWRKRNAPEIDLARSLEQITATDLSVHLFNAFALRRRGAQQQERLKALGGSEGLEAVDEAAEGEGEGGYGWMPPKYWTAWPLKVGRVPEDDFMPRDPHEKDGEWWEGGKGGKGVGRELFYGGFRLKRMPEPYLPRIVKASEGLEEALLAMIMRQGKDMWNRRLPADGSRKSEKSRPRSKSGQRQRGESGYTTDPQTSGYESRESNTEDETSRSFQRSRLQKSAATHNPNESSTQYKPVPLADDTLALQILKPQIRHILSNLNTLLRVLHTSRASYSGVPGSNIFPAGERNRSTSRPGMRSRSKTRMRSQSRGRRRASPPAGSASGDSDGIGYRKQNKRRRSRSSVSVRLHERKKKLNLRNWEDLIGFAGMAGFESKAVKRARERCQGLFGAVEGAGATKQPEATGGGGGDGIHLNERGEEMLDHLHLDGFLQPIKGKRSWRVKGKGKDDEARNISKPE